MPDNHQQIRTGEEPVDDFASRGSGSEGPRSGDAPSRKDDSSGRKASQEEIRVGWKMAGIGFEVASVVVAGVLIGWGIDYFAGTDRRWMLIGGIGGILVACLTFIRETLKLNKKLDQIRTRKTPK